MYFILGQICGLIAWLALLLSYYRKNTKGILLIQIISIVFYILNYLFLGAYTGLVVVIFELIKTALYYKTDRRDIIYMLSIPVYALLAYLNRGNIVELIPVLASAYEGYTLIHEKRTVVYGAIVVYTLWVIYDISVQAYTGALTDGLIVISNIGIMIKMRREDKKFFNRLIRKLKRHGL